jgi:hypothetical protein
MRSFAWCERDFLPDIHRIGRRRVKVGRGRAKELFVALEIPLNRRQISDRRRREHE